MTFLDALAGMSDFETAVWLGLVAFDTAVLWCLWWVTRVPEVHEKRAQ